MQVSARYEKKEPTPPLEVHLTLDLTLPEAYLLQHMATFNIAVPASVSGLSEPAREVLGAMLRDLHNALKRTWEPKGDGDE